MQTWDDVFAAFGTVATLAGLIGVPYQTAAAWRRRNSIPSRYWPKLVEIAADAGAAGLTLESLSRVELAALQGQQGTAA